MDDGRRIPLGEPETRTGQPPRRRRRPRRGLVRLVLLAIGPLLLITAGVWFYLSGGRFVSTDNAFVQAETTTISTDVAGTVLEVDVHDNESVAAGQLLFRLDPEPFRIALAEAEAQLAVVRDGIAATQAEYRDKLKQVDQAKADVAHARRQYSRYRELLDRGVVARKMFEDAEHDLKVAQEKLGGLAQEAAAVLARLGGSTDIPARQQSGYKLAEAAVARAERNLRRTTVTAPGAGIVTNVESLQPGEYLAAGAPAFSLVKTGEVWVEANPKETDLTNVRPGQSARVVVDTYPDRIWPATVASVSPATGAEFSLIPPQNASGNWVKVVQRIPVRVRFDDPRSGPPLRAGMSATVEIDTGRERTLGGLLADIGDWLGL